MDVKDFSLEFLDINRWPELLPLALFEDSKIMPIFRNREIANTFELWPTLLKLSLNR